VIDKYTKKNCSPNWLYSQGVDNLYHLQNYHRLMEKLVLVVLCAGDEISENFFITHDNKTTNANWFFLEKISFLPYTLLI